MDTKYQIHYPNGESETIDATTGATAKSVAKAVRKLTGQDVELVRVQRLDIDAPPRQRKTEAE